MSAPTFTLRERLAGSGRPVLATFVSIPRVEVIKMLAVAGFDAVIIDLEHGPFGIEAVPHLAAASAAAGMYSIVRVADDRAVGIGAALDAGAEGVLVPHVSERATAEAVVEAARFPPLGHRGANPWVFAGRYGTDPNFFSTANDTTAVIAMVEGSDGIANLDQILAVDGIDAIFVGPVDLSSALGHPGQTDHPEVVGAVTDIVQRGQSAAMATAVFSPTPEAADRWLMAGARLVALGVDAGLIVEGLRRHRAAVTQLPTMPNT